MVNTRMHTAAREAVLENRQSRPGFRLLARAHCTFPDGETRCLYATDLCLGGAFILCMKPPPIGTRLTVTLYPLGHPPLASIEARVIGLRIDPADAERSGFELVFVHLEDDLLDRLSEIVAELELLVEPPRPREKVIATEQRAMPRVHTDLHAVVNLSGSAISMRVLNLSLSGALLGLGERLLPKGMALGAEVTLSILAPSVPERISLLARVVRLTGPNEPRGLALCFIDLDHQTELRLEGLMIEIVARRYLLGPGQE